MNTPQFVFLSLMTVALGIISACVAIRLSAPHIKSGHMSLRIVLAITLYCMVKTCLTAFAMLAANNSMLP